MSGSRRGFLGALVAAAGAAAGRVFGPRSAAASLTLRPPGALVEPDFLARCVRCFQCGDVCPNACIQFRGLEAGLAEAGTPYIRPREQGCTTCMKCTQVCPTGALRPTPADEAVILATVKMGVARLNREMCYSYADPPRTCGVCYRACPFPGKAMSIGLYEQPVVHRDQCVGCGLCEQACIHLPQAIRVIPVDREGA